MSRIDNLKAVAEDWHIPVGDLIDLLHSYGRKQSAEVEVSKLLAKRIEASEKVGLSTDYINGLKDARKLAAPQPNDPVGNLEGRDD